MSYSISARWRDIVSVWLAACLAAAAMPGVTDAAAQAPARGILEKIGSTRGLCVLLGGSAKGKLAVELARQSELVVYVQSPDGDEVAAVRRAAEAGGLLGKRIYAERGSWKRIHLADNLADAVVLDRTAQMPGAVARAEVLRVLRPGGKAMLGGEVLTKPVPEGIDDWTHPYHGPDNNPQSTDQLARAPYLTQFLATPLWGCQPQVTVMAGGRAFRAFGHMAFRAYQNAAINTLYAMSSYNGAILWKRKLEPGFMIHRNAMIATPEVLYLADDESCKLIDAATGELKGRIAPPPETAGGTVWKWMALEGGVLYALLGAAEVTADVRPGQGARISGWPWSMWKGYDYKDPNTAWGFGRALLAIDPRSKKVLWSHRAEELVDSRGVCMHSGRIFFYSRGKSLGCLNASDGKVRWQTSDAKLLEAIGPDTRAQTAKFGFTTSVYAKCTADVLLFAGPQRPNLVAVSTGDGKLLWQKKDGNFQLVLRPDALYAMGAGKSLKLDYRTGEVLGEIHGRQACTRATGSVDSIFVRGRGTRRVEVPSANRSEHITPMRPSCHDGVIVSNGLLHWSPWICGCSLCLFGNVCLGPAGDFDPQRAVDESAQREPGEGDWQRVKAPPAEANDWPAYLANSRRTFTTAASPPVKPARQWEFKPLNANAATPPTVAYGLVFLGGSDGIVRAVDAASGKLRWKACTAGGVRFPPAVWNGRAYVGSYDGYVYAFEAATGRLLWRFRAAPIERKIPVYGMLASTWPVAGGVIAEDGVVYAAAGIAHYDGTHVYALDAVTGKVKWHNGTSGRLNPAVNNGISLQGVLRLDANTLSFPGGNVYARGVYDIETGKLSDSRGRAKAGRTIFHPWQASEPLEDAGPQPSRGSNQAFSFQTPRGRVDVAGGSVSLQPTVKPQKAEPEKGKPPKERPKPVWTHTTPSTCRAVVRAADKLLLAQVAKGPGPAGSLSALSLQDGKLLWEHPLPGVPVTHGLAVDHEGRVYASLVDGRVICVAGRGKETSR